MNQSLALLLMTLSTAGELLAQSVSPSMRAATQLTLSLSGGATVTLPPGPLAASGSLSDPSSGFSAMGWATTADSTEASCYWSHYLQSASAGPHEVVMEWTPTASAPIPVELRLVYSFTSPPGVMVPEMLVDYGNDGVFEASFGTSQELSFPLLLGPQPYAIRLRYTGTAFTTSVLSASVLPRNDLQIDTLEIGCVPGYCLLAPTFQGRGVVLLPASPPPPGLSVLVAGLAPQPLLLPPAFGAPCLVMPSPDVLLLWLPTDQIPIAIPAAARPLDLWLQRVWVGQTQPLPAEAYVVRAF